MIGPPVDVPEQPVLVDPIVEAPVEPEPAYNYFSLDAVESDEEEVVEEPVVVAPEPEPTPAVEESSYNYFTLDAVDEDELVAPTVNVVPAETEVVVDDAEKEVAIVDPEPAVYVAPSQ